MLVEAIIAAVIVSNHHKNLVFIRRDIGRNIKIKTIDTKTWNLFPLEFLDRAMSANMFNEQEVSPFRGVRLKRKFYENPIVLKREQCEDSDCTFTLLRFQPNRNHKTKLFSVTWKCSESNAIWPKKSRVFG